MAGRPLLAVIVQSPVDPQDQQNRFVKADGAVEIVNGQKDMVEHFCLLLR